MKAQTGSTLSFSSALGGGGGLKPCPSRFIPRKETQYPLYRRLGGPQGQSGQLLKTWITRGFDSRTIQPTGVGGGGCRLKVACV
jgi:hypothetical protein